jgi:hypothetical protein
LDATRCYIVEEVRMSLKDMLSIEGACNYTSTVVLDDSLFIEIPRLVDCNISSKTFTKSKAGRNKSKQESEE